MKKNQQKTISNPDLPLGKKNYIFIGIGIAAIILGLIVLSGGGSDDPDVFNYEMFNFRRLFIAPLLMLGGFVFEIYAIMYRPKTNKKEEDAK